MPNKNLQPPQEQSEQPGREYKMTPRPQAEKGESVRKGRLENKVAMITGGDSGIGRAVAIAFAKEGADVAILYLEEHRDAVETKRLVEETGRKCILIPGDLCDDDYCRSAVEECIDKLDQLDILVNNAAYQQPQESIMEISREQLEKTFRTNILAMFSLTKAALEHIPEGGAIINSSSVTAFRGSDHLIDYSATKGAIVSFTRSLAKSLVKKKIRVNCVAPGPVWTPLIPST